MTLAYAVSFEFETRAPETHRGRVEGSREHVCAARAIRQARQALRPINWTSVVCVLARSEFQTPRIDAGEES